MEKTIETHEIIKNAFLSGKNLTSIEVKNIFGFSTSQTSSLYALKGYIEKINRNEYNTRSVHDYLMKVKHYPRFKNIELVHFEGFNCNIERVYQTKKTVNFEFKSKEDKEIFLKKLANLL